ncbi:MAG: alpha/beta hydrolase [Chloroflexota bacterium]
MQNLNHTYIQTNGIQLHVTQAGPENGPLVFLLHGFPEFWYGWRQQILALANAGYRVWIPDQRGYNLSDKPKGVAAYSLNHLAADIVGLIDAAGAESIYLVGHDWGAAVSWWLAVHYPERVKKLVILNVPHHSVMGSFLRRNLAQIRRSWYIFYFQIPWLPEKMVRARSWYFMERALTGSSQEGTFSQLELARYRAAWSEEGALTGMLNWYRALLQKRPSFPADDRVTMPTLIIWGQQDGFLAYEMAQLSQEMCDNGRLVIIPDATHWVQHEAAEQVNELILSFIAAED